MSVRNLSVALLTCNECNVILGSQFVDPQEARFWLKSIGGWSEPRRDYDLCADCRTSPGSEHGFVERVQLQDVERMEEDLCARCGVRRRIHE